ncbi:MAG: exodeoxyribonuclease V subunit gamma, partial [Mariprofundaceae bacterium]|nr:exodeoxyribonuclease V subunit gamma [Mariprofundaceae bacterium]
MGFHLISSNKMEVLMNSMANILRDEPLSNPLMPDTILVSGVPMQRWLGLKLADAMGIQCNIDYPQPTSWLWSLIARNSGQSDALSRESSAWLIFQYLPELLTQDAFAPLYRYLEDDEDGIKRWQLADRIADTLDRYQYYRPDTIRHWSAGGGNDWQAKLWRTLLKHVGQHHHRIAMMDQWQKDLAQ